LLDNYMIGPSLVNQVFELPKVFKCAPPYGVELLQVNAQTSLFEPLSTRQQGGYKFITDDLNTIVSKTRGFVPDEEGEAVTEKQITITTLKN